MKLSTFAYETAKLLVIEHLFGDTFFKDYSIVSCINEDECQNQVGSLYRIFNKKKNGSQGIQLKFSVNFYHTTSSILVNGNRVDIFESELFDPICNEIKASCSKLRIVNDQIAQALSEVGVVADSRKDTETHAKEKEYDTFGQVNYEIALCEPQMVPLMNSQLSLPIPEMTMTVLKANTCAPLEKSLPNQILLDLKNVENGTILIVSV